MLLMSSDEDRYQEIVRRIAKGKAENTTPEPALKVVLDKLNALDMLETFASYPYARTLCYGPQVLKGAEWVGVVVWYRNKGYYGYRRLTICGIWTVQEQDSIRVILGERMLDYAAPVYVAEAYHKLIRKGFHVYYDDRGEPPVEDDVDMQMIYDPNQRLVIRQQMESQLQQWAADL